MMKDSIPLCKESDSPSRSVNGNDVLHAIGIFFLCLFKIAWRLMKIAGWIFLLIVTVLANLCKK